MKLAAVNSRGQISLGKFAEADYYMIVKSQDGELRLIPAIIQPANKAQKK